ncbi:MAG TPA: ABC transporter ATP-binding protein [Gemmatimonadaceae bacterium]|nr:ABC transporter ATP-binding protein [Gemmatimonadaceae bacterium]
MTTLVRTEGVRRDYRLGEDVVHAVRGVDLTIEAGDWVAIVGPSGCGKSTLLNLLGAIDAPSAGRVMVKERDVSSLSDREATRFRLHEVGFVFQRFYLVPALSAIENVELPMAEAGIAKDERRRRALELLSYVGIAERARHRPAQLSGGEQQRVAIARALANRPSLLLADEPTGELDARTGAEIIALLSRVNRDGATVVVVTHDEELAAAARRVIHMRDGVIVDDRVRETGAHIPVHLHDDAGERVVHWPLRTLIAWLFVGRECDQVRSLLGRGETVRNGTRAMWTPVHLSADELTAIERTFPAADPARALDLTQAKAVLVRRGKAITLAPDDSRAREASARAVYKWFDYGPWADVWEATHDGDVVRFEMPRTGEAPPWSTAS